MRSVVFWGLLPVTALQGLALRRRALRLTPPPGEAHGQFAGSQPALKLLALGDSIIAGIGASAQEHTLPYRLAEALAQRTQRSVLWCAAGENGARSADLLQRVTSLDASTEADLILLSIGVNDVTGLVSLRQWSQRVDRLCRELRRRWPTAIVVFAGLPPMEKFPLPPQPLRASLGLRAAQLDRIARQRLAAEPDFIHIPTTINPEENGFCADGFHPDEKSYAAWGQELAQRIAPMLQT